MIPLDKVRLETPGCKKCIHFNNACASLPPQPVVDMMTQYLQQEALTGGYELAAEYRKEIKNFYKNTAELVGTHPQNIAFTYSATQAFIKAISSIPFEPGDIILTTINDYVSNQLAFLSLKKRLGIKVMYGKESPQGGVDIEDMKMKIVTFKPKLVSVTHVPTNSGLIQDVEAIGKICRKYNIWYLVDACQSAGQIDLDMTRIGCDFLSATFRKFMRGPRGAGFLAISERVISQNLTPLYIDLTSARWTGYDEYQIEHSAIRFEEFEKNYALVLGSSEAVKYLLDLGVPQVSERTIHLANKLRLGLGDHPHLTVLDPGERLCGIISFTSTSIPRRKWIKTLKQNQIHFSIIGKQNAWIDYENRNVDWAIRLSPHYYNTDNEIQQVIDLLSGLA